MGLTLVVHLPKASSRFLLDHLPDPEQLKKKVGSQVKFFGCILESCGHVKIFENSHENGCPWNEKCCKFASREGHLEVLKYLHEK